MIKSFINNFLDEVMEKIQKEFEETKEYEEALKPYDENYAKVLNTLPKDQAFEIIDGLECSFNNLCAITRNYFYKQGLKDGVEMFKTFKATNVEFSEECISPLIRSAGIGREYREKVKEKAPIGCLNIEEYIYKKAFEEGKKAGYRQALY